MKTLFLAAAAITFATAVSACPFSMSSEKTADAPILKPADSAGS